MLCVARGRDNNEQHWVEMMALPRHNTITPLAGLLRRVHCYYDFFLNNGGCSIEKRIERNFS